MPFRSASVVRFHFGGYDAGTHTTSVHISLALDAALDPTALTDVAERVLAGIRNDKVTWAGLFNTGAKSLDSAQALVGTGTHIISLHLGSAAAEPAYLGTSFILAKQNSFNIKELVREEAEFILGGTLMTGTVLYTQTVSTGTQTGTAVDYGALTTGTLSYFVHVFQLTTGTLNVLVESALTTAAAYTLHASANITTATGTILTATGSINRFVRHRHINTVATGTQDVAAAAGKT